VKGTLTYALALAVALLLFGGCATEVGEGTLELGTGEWRYEPISDGDDVDLIRGAQGGVHVWLSVHATGFDPDRVTMEIVTEKLDGSLAPETSVVDVRLDPAAEEGAPMYELLGWPAVLAAPGCVVDSELLVTVTLTDADGTTATDQHVIVPRGTDMPACEL
jgi:hypothetical protein